MNFSSVCPRLTSCVQVEVLVAVQLPGEPGRVNVKPNVMLKGPVSGTARDWTPPDVNENASSSNVATWVWEPNKLPGVSPGTSGPDVVVAGCALAGSFHQVSVMVPPIAF